MAWFGGRRMGSTGRRGLPLGLWVLLVFACCEAAQGQSEPGLDDLRERAAAAYERGALLEALPDYERLVSLFPEEGCLHGRLAGCALREPGRLTLARRHLGIAIRMECQEVDVEFHRARLAQLEYDFERARDLYTSYLLAAGKKARFKSEAELGQTMCGAVVWDVEEAVGLKVLDRIPADPEAAFRFYQPETPGLRLVNVPASLRSKADQKRPPGRMAFHDGDTVLVFSSLGRNGKTGWDLYRMAIENGVYGEPVKLGDAVNTPFDEQDAYLAPEGILYFSSNRPGGLGGQDIYAVEWVGGAPFGQPYRLPFPINSVNDDQFFIPEPDGGAWMASNRAAKAGRIHAYRVDLSEEPVVRGTVSWVPDEVDGEGLTLRVYSGGEVVSEVPVGAGEATHMSFPAGQQDVGLRVELRGRNGEVLAESVGSTDGAWDLRRQNGQWNVEERPAGDWAAVADLRPEAVSKPGEGAVDPLGAEEDVSNPAPAWSDWVRTQIPTPVGASEGGSALAGGGIEPPEPGVEDNETTFSRAGAEEIESGDDSAKVTPELDPEVVPDPEVLAEVLEARPEEAIAVWESKARRVLALESDFLDNPDFSKAGELYDLISDLEAWRPEADRIVARLRDGLQTEDIAGMLDAWTYAVQSATNPALAQVAGEAALAFRREKLAIRELWSQGEPHLTPLMRRFSDWLDARRGVDGVDPAAAVLTREEGDALMEGWRTALGLGSEAWTRKQRSGWRGDWLRRQEEQQAAQESLWLEARPDLPEGSASLGSDEAADASLALSDSDERKEDPVSGADWTGEDTAEAGGKAPRAEPSSESQPEREGQVVDAASIEEEPQMASGAVDAADAAEVATAETALPQASDSDGDDRVAVLGDGEPETDSEGAGAPKAQGASDSRNAASSTDAASDILPGVEDGGEVLTDRSAEEQPATSVRWQPLPEEGQVEDWAMLGFVFPELEGLSLMPTPGMSLVTGEDEPDAAMEAWQGKNMQREWMEAMAGDKDVRKAWESLLRVAAGQGVPAVTGSAALLELDPDVAEALVELRQSMMEALATRVAGFQRSGRDGLRDWKVWVQAHEEQASSVDANVWEPLTQLAETRSETAREQARFNPSKDVVATFERQEQWMAAMNREAAAWIALEDRTATLLDAGREGVLEDVVLDLLAARDAVMLASEAEVVVSEESEATAALRGEGAEPEESTDVASLSDGASAGGDEVAEGRDAAEATEPAAGADSRTAQENFPVVDGLRLDEAEGDGQVDVASNPRGRPSENEGVAESVSDAVGDLAWSESRPALAEVLESVMADGVQRERMASILEWTSEWTEEGPNGTRAGIVESDWRVLEAWREWSRIESSSPPPSATGRQVNQWEKQRFFAEKAFRQALESVDVVAFMDRLDAVRAGSPDGGVEEAGEEVAARVTRDGAADVEASPVTEPDREEPFGNAERADAVEATPRAQQPEETTAGDVVTTDEEESVRVEVSAEVDDRTEDAALVARSREAERRAEAFGLILPEAEVVGATEGAPRGAGLRLRPIARTDIERAILSAEREEEVAEAESAEAAFASAEPRAEGVEYKIQVGAFRNALPAALFAAFDPMWAQRLANGVTRYMAGSFDAYDPAVVARDAIRALGYEDAFVVRFVDGERLGASRPDPADLAEERSRTSILPLGGGNVAGSTGTAAVGELPRTAPSNPSVPTRREDIPTWEEIEGRVYSVQVGAFRGVPDAQALSGLGALTREDAGQDGWLRLFSGRFDTEDQAVAQRDVLRAAGRTDAFVVVYVNGRRIPLSEAATTAVVGLNGLTPPPVDPEPVDDSAPSVPETGNVTEAWFLELGAFSSTIPVRLANAILDAPLDWQIRSSREGGQTVYRTRTSANRAELEPWLTEARAQGFVGARIVRREGGSN